MEDGHPRLHELFPKDSIGGFKTTGKMSLSLTMEKWAKEVGMGHILWMSDDDWMDLWDRYHSENSDHIMFHVNQR